MDFLIHLKSYIVNRPILSRSSWLIVMFVSVFTFRIIAAPDELEQIKQAISEKGANWTAGENWITKLPPEERNKLCGTILDPKALSKATLLSIPLIENLPPVFDWRDNDGNWVTSVKNQGQCGNCWDFSTVAQVEAWWKIYNANSDSMIDLSEQFILSCSEATCTSGWTIEATLDFIKSTGVPTETCFEYKADDEIPCSTACDNWEDESVTIPGWGYITLNEDIIENIKSAVYLHPVSASFIVYQDFYSYSGGVYEYVLGEEEGRHAILIVGWNDTKQSWICKNSWGENWGESGYFRIKWGNCDIGKNIPFIWDEMTGGPALSVSPEQLVLSLTVGDSALETINLSNLGTDILEFSSIDYEVPITFHPDTFKAWDGKSWWCADPEIGGYDDHWLQYLDTPIIDLSNTVVPKLFWMGNWSIEDPSSAESPWDGWDGCNVWISTDGGQNFNVAYPTHPNYTSLSLWSFGHDEQGWDMGVGIAGWGGSSDGWIPVEFDLSPYKSDSVIIRFAFASDLAYCSVDDSLIYGLLIDDIKVIDRNDVLIEDHADDIFYMRRTGFGNRKADWLDLHNATGVIRPGESTSIDVAIRTRGLSPGNYLGLIKISSNDTTLTSLEIPCNLEINEPNDQNGVSREWNLAQNYPNPFNTTTRINYTLPEAGNVTVVIYNLVGQVVRDLLRANQSPGHYFVDWDGRDNNENRVATGVYLYRLEVENQFSATKKIVFLK